MKKNYVVTLKFNDGCEAVYRVSSTKGKEGAKKAAVERERRNYPKTAASPCGPVVKKTVRVSR